MCNPTFTGDPVFRSSLSAEPASVVVYQEVTANCHLAGRAHLEEWHLAMTSW